VTTTDDATTARHALAGPRPQPLGVLPWPAGMLVLPGAGAEGEAAAAALLAGAEPAVWPPDWAFLAAALEGDSERAAALVPGDDVVAAYNRAVLVGGDWSEITAAAEGDLAVLAATARFSVGDTDEPPSAQASAGEVAAVARSARASAALEHGDVTTALAELDAGTSAAAAAGSPLLAATLRGSKAELLRHTLDDPAGAEAEATAALALLPTPAPEELHAELLVTRAMARQQQGSARPDLLTAAVADYLEALRVYREETHPELFATCNQHLALCYLQLPMGTQADRIRVGVAVNALRAALRVYTPETHPWPGPARSSTSPTRCSTCPAPTRRRTSTRRCSSTRSCSPTATPWRTRPAPRACSPTRATRWGTSASSPTPGSGSSAPVSCSPTSATPNRSPVSTRCSRAWPRPSGPPAPTGRRAEVDPYRRQHFDWLLHEASADFVERVVHRCGGPQPALEALRADPQGEGVWLDQFVEAVFDEHLLGDAAVPASCSRRSNVGRCPPTPAARWPRCWAGWPARRSPRCSPPAPPRTSSAPRPSPADGRITR
jgi:hypothetical protein